MDALNQAQRDGVVIGLKDVAGVVPRLDVDQLLLQEPDTFNLFLLALQNLQQEDTSDIMGYYQIAGIILILTTSEHASYFQSRYSWSPKIPLGQCRRPGEAPRRRRPVRVLYAWLNPVPHLASSIHGNDRGKCSDSKLELNLAYS